jgi:hypothetical protein
MKSLARLALAALLVVALLAAPAARADDNVTIPKSKLEELERKAAELEKLQRELKRSETENQALQKAKVEAEAKAAADAKAAKAAQAAAAQATREAQAAAAKAEADAKAAQARANSIATNPAPAYVAAPMASLPPLGPDAVVSSLDLLAHFVANEDAARARYGAKKEHITVEGEIVGFKRVPFVSPYAVLLKTGEPARRVEAWFMPADRFKAVYTKRNGTQLVGLTKDREAEVTLYRAGQVLTVTARCGNFNEDGLFAL